MNNELSPKEIDALIHLLDDTDDEVFSHVRGRIITLGESVIPQLEEVWENSFNHLLQTRIEDIIHRIQQDSLSLRLSRWVENGGISLLEGAMLIARYQYPDLDEKPILRQLMILKKDMEVELKEKMTPIQQVKMLNHVLFDMHGFTSNKVAFHAPANNFINNVLDSKRGNPLSLAIVYIILCEYLDIPVKGVNLPEHFILAYLGKPVSVLPEDERHNEVMFYINPFSKGTVFSKREIDTFLTQLKIARRPEFYKPCSNIHIIQRLLNNLIFAYEGMGYHHKVEELKALRQIVA